MTTTTDISPSHRALDGLPAIMKPLANLYRDLHAHPELSNQEHRTAAKAADQLEWAGCEVSTGIGGTGVVGVLRNGDGPTVMLRADMDALPVEEDTGLPYASTVTATGPDGHTVPVMHACGHDMHITWLAGATKLLARTPDAWHGTLISLFQPAEELGTGAQGMIDDHLFERFPKPDVILGQHVLPPAAGEISYRSGVTQSEEDNIEVRLFGRGGHGAWPDAAIDPVVMAAATVLRLQTIVSREVAALEPAVVTTGSLQSGTKGNVAGKRHRGLLFALAKEKRSSSPRSSGISLDRPVVVPGPVLSSGSPPACSACRSVNHPPTDSAGLALSHRDDPEISRRSRRPAIWWTRRRQAIGARLEAPGRCRTSRRATGTFSAPSRIGAVRRARTGQLRHFSAATPSQKPQLWIRSMRLAGMS